MIFYWTIPTSYNFACEHLRNNGYTILRNLEWYKYTSTGKLINSKNIELSREICLVGYKGNVDQIALNSVPHEIHSVVRSNSEKPE